MPRLRILTMRNNRMTFLPEATFRSLRSNIAVLDLDGNPLECTCNMMWYRSWLQESDAQQPGPRCGNGKMLRELPLSRSDCEVYEKNNHLTMPLTNEHGDLFARQAMEGGPCESEPFEELKSGLPPPEESEYFDQSVDYPSNETESSDQSTPQLPPDHPLNPQQHNPQSLPPSHSLSPFNDEPSVGKGFNRSNTLLNLNPPPRPHHPQEQPFSIFGIPIPSFGQLFGQGRHANGRASSVAANPSSRGRGRVQLYRNDDPELLKLLNKNEVQVGVGGRPSAANNHPNGLQNRPLFQTPFQEPSNVQKGGFVPMLPGDGGFQPMENGSKIEGEQNDTLSSNKNSEEDDGEEKRFQEVLTVVQAEKPRIKISNKNDPLIYSSNEEHDSSAEDQKVELGSPIDLPTNEIPPIETESPAVEPDEAKEDQERSPPPEQTPSPLELDYYDRAPEEDKEKNTPVVNWNNKDPQRNELSALVAPGAQQGIYRVPPGRSTITKVFTPSPGSSSSSSSTGTTTNAPVVPAPEEFYRTDPQTHEPPHVGSEVQSVASLSNSYNSKSSPDWYFETYNRTDPPKLVPKRSYATSATPGSGSVSRESLFLTTTISTLLLLRHLYLGSFVFPYS